ncbi:AMP-dependent synthetase/ligase [Halomarina salina]|uniref:AMP-dependent synthetase/ligase n=1 Tax=Halomarina salina TaxID=1872699 RepID=A0ABD5RKS1_9EURY|nr:long-chain fatty acid--CoA ligase [Halomarina salina]
MAIEHTQSGRTVGEIHRGEPLDVPDGPLARWFSDRVRSYGDLPATVHREKEGAAFVETTYEALYAEAVAVAGGFLETMEPGDRLGIRAETRYEWSLVDLASVLAGLVLVPVYPSFSPEQARYVIEDAGVRTLVTEEELPLDVAGAVEWVVDITDLPREEDTAATDLPGFDATDDDVTSIIYTSGTTGFPKGCELTHRNVLAEMAAIGGILPAVPGDTGTCFLPLSHIYQRVSNYADWDRGVAAVFITIPTLVEDLGAIEPNGFVTVPRVYRRMYDGVQRQLREAAGPRGRIARWAVAVAHEYGRAIDDGGVPAAGLRARHALAERLVYGQLREQLGLTEVRYAITGAASIDPDLLHFFWGIGVPVLEGYGATETTAGVTLSRPGERRAGTVGRPLPGVEIALADDGEVLVRGPQVFRGYWNDPDATAAALDDDGWYHTGDVGEWVGDCLRIVDRKKRLQVLDTGKNVYPGPIETALRRSPYVAEAMVVGEGRKYVSALVQPDFDALVAFAEAEGIAFDADDLVRDELGTVVSVPTDLLDHEAVRDLLQSEVDAVNEGLAEYERVKRIAVVERAFSVEQEELTPTLKKRRGTIGEHFGERIEALYA